MFVFKECHSTLNKNHLEVLYFVSLRLIVHAIYFMGIREIWLLAKVATLKLYYLIVHIKSGMTLLLIKLSFSLRGDLYIYGYICHY